MFRSLPLGAALGVFAFGLSGCTGQTRARDASMDSGILVRAELVYVHQAGTPAGEVGVEALAHFARFRPASSAHVPRLLGLNSADDIPSDTCRTTDAARELDVALLSQTGQSGTGQVEVSLLDAGGLEAHVNTGSLTLRQSPYPEVVPGVSGLVYTNDRSVLPLAFDGVYRLVGEGGADVGPVQATVRAPQAFANLVATTLGADGLRVTWTPPLQPSDAALELVLRAGTRTTRCRVLDDGDFVVPQPVVPSTLTLTRAQRGPLDAPGLGAGEWVVELREIAQVAP